MRRGFKYFLIYFISIAVVCYGFLVVSSSLPKFIKDRSSIKVNFNPSPFDLTFDVGNYIIYINNKSIINIKDNTIEKIKNNPIHDFINDVKSN